MSATQTVPAVVPVAPLFLLLLLFSLFPLLLAVAPAVAPPKRTKMPILCSKVPKMGIPKAKSAQKPGFCARNVRKRGSRRQKAHKNPDFVLERPENGGFEGQKSTKTPILCSKCPKTWVPEAKKAQKPRFCAREEGDWHQGERKLASGSATAETFTLPANHRAHL